MAGFWREMKELLATSKGLVPIIQAGKCVRRADVLRRKGRVSEAYDAANKALDLLRRPNVVRISPPALTLILAATGLLDDLAVALGKRGASFELVEALDACHAAILDCPRMAEVKYLRDCAEKFRARVQEAEAFGMPKQ